MNSTAVDYNRRSGTISISLHALTVFLVISIFFIPDYFGVSVFNCQRVALLLIWYIIFRNPERRSEFFRVIASFRFNKIIAVYLVVLLITSVYRLNLNTFLNPFFDQVVILYTMIYLFNKEISIKKFLSILIAIAYLLCLLGLVEYALQNSIFLKFETIKGLTGGMAIRGGRYRVMGPAHHALGYGLYLQIMIPISGYDCQKNEINPFKRLFLLLLISVNIFLTNSRSALGLMLVELVVVFLISPRKVKRGLFLMICYFAVIGGSIIVLFYKTSFVQSILVSTAQVLDAVFGGSLAVELGADTTIYELSEEYRDLLPEIFKLNWLNPWIGRGNGYQFNWNYQGFWVNSIDNYYVNQYIKVAYSGLIIQCIFYIAMIGMMVRAVLIKHSKVCLVVLISCLFYFITLWWVDALGTLDYIFMLFALVYTIHEDVRGVN